MRTESTGATNFYSSNASLFRCGYAALWDCSYVQERCRMKIHAKKILIVDDEETLLWVFDEVLGDEDYDIESTADSIEALKLASKTTYDLVISDLLMPNLNGLQLISKIKKIQPNIKTIIITACKSTEVINKAARIGVVNVIEKPFNIEDVKAVIHRILRKKASLNNLKT